MTRLVFSVAMFLGGAGSLLGGLPLPVYDEPSLQARANFTDSFNLPIGAFWSNITLQLNDVGGVAFHLNVVPGTTGRGVWYGENGVGQIEYVSPENSFVNGVSLNNAGKLVFQQFDSSPSGIFFYDSATDMSGLETNLPFGASGWSSPQINDTGHIGYRAGFTGGNAYAVYDGASATILAAEVDLDVGSPYSFLFTPSFNGSGHIAAKVRLGASGQLGESQPDQIRIFTAPGVSTLIAEDQDSLAGSPYARFDNSVSLTENGWVAFIANLPTGLRGVFLSNGTATVAIANEGDPDISEIEFFAPAANENGWVAFRAFDAVGLRAIWVGDGTDLVRVVGEHDLVPTDLGMARIDQHDSGPVFGGGVFLNASGDLGFTAGLTPPDNNQIEWGSGAFVARPIGIPVLNATMTDGPVPLFGKGFSVSPGEGIRYSVVVENPLDAANDPETGIEFSLIPDPRTQLTVGSVTTDTGTVTGGNQGGDTEVAVAVGSLPAGASATISFDLAVLDPFPPATDEVAVQGTVSSDLSAAAPTDDPDDETSSADPTRTPVDVPADNDFRFLLQEWRNPAAPFVTDLNGNGLIDILEIVDLVFLQR